VSVRSYSSLYFTVGVKSVNCCKCKVKNSSQQNIHSAGESGLFCNTLLMLKYEGEKCVLGEGLENHLLILM
jgi:hypothetical protein